MVVTIDSWVCTEEQKRFSKEIKKLRFGRSLLWPEFGKELVLVPRLQKEELILNFGGRSGKPSPIAKVYEEVVLQMSYIDRMGSFYFLSRIYC
ncbi:hypothetical protein C5167_008692 [Papaver somniferum]|uniref:Uncharacterized protein n=1 Tax=Papaver somniferum TaxID=3469 RepID=A0A4Y7JY88_PAPSO|nr:hypothetical protein C5167_008692 [Papaver somniferum]